MDELIKKVSEKTGLSEEMARQAVEVVVDHLKDKLPGPLAGQIDNVLNLSGKSGGLSGLAGGLLGK